MKTRCFLLATALVTAQLFVAPVRAADAKTYTVVFHRPSKIGEKFSESITMTRSQQITISNSPSASGQSAPTQRQQHKLVVRFEAEGEALALSPRENWQKGAYVVRRFTQTEDDQPEKEVLPVGSKIVVENTGASGMTYTVDGKPAPAEAREPLKLVLHLGDSKIDDQTLMGPSTPMAVGASWPVNGKAFVEKVQDELGKDAVVTGMMRLDEAKGSGDTQVTMISGSVTIRNIQPPNLPPGFLVKAAESRSNLSFGLPASPKAGNNISINNLTTTTISGAISGSAGSSTNTEIVISGQVKMEGTYR